MTKTSVAAALRELAKNDEHRSETARLRDVIDDVEAALTAGVSRPAVLKALHEQGFTMTMKSFESALYRIRKQRKKGNTKSPSPTLGHDQGKEETPSNPVDIPAGSTMRQRGEAVADQYMTTTSTNPLLSKITKEK